jgi:regulator of replication initiation timing
MNEDFLQRQFETLSNKVQQIVLKYGNMKERVRILEEENQKLVLQNQQLNETVKKKDESIVELSKNSTFKSKNSQNSDFIVRIVAENLKNKPKLNQADQETAAVRKQIDEFIQDIERCIEQLK